MEDLTFWFNVGTGTRDDVRRPVDSETGRRQCPASRSVAGAGRSSSTVSGAARPATLSNGDRGKTVGMDDRPGWSLGEELIQVRRPGNRITSGGSRIPEPRTGDAKSGVV